MDARRLILGLEQRARAKPARSRWIGLAVCTAVALAAAAVVVWGRPPLLWLLVLGLVIHLALWWARQLAPRESGEWPAPVRQLRAWATRHRRKISLAAVVAIVVSVVVLWRLESGAAQYLVGVVAYVALGAGLRAWRRDAETRWRRGIGVLGGCVAVGVVALVVGTVNVNGTWLLVLLAAVVVTPVGIGLVAEHFASRPELDERLLLAWGLVIVLGGIAVLSLAAVGTYQALIGMVALGLLVAAISSNTSHDIVLVLLVIGLVWSLDPAVGPPEPDPTAGTPAAAKPTIVAIGDSYISGEGANAYFEGTNHNHTDDRNECRRAPTAHPVVTRELLDERGVDHELLFVACSGAKARQLTTEAQYRGEPATPWEDRQSEPTADDLKQRKGQPQLVQARAAVDALHLDPQLVFVSIGGNDAGFGEIGRVCGLPGDCSVLGQQWLDELADTRERLRETYPEIRRTFPKARIVVVPYPVPLSESGCRASLLRPNEHRFLAGFTRALDRMIAEEAARPGLDFEFAVGVVETFTRSRTRICDTSPSAAAVNQVAASPVAGVFLQQVSPRQWFHNSFHPNERGHERIAKELVSVVTGTADEKVLERRQRWLADVLDAPTTLHGIMGLGFDHCLSAERAPATCHADRTSWSTAATARLLWILLVPVLMVTSGSVLVTVVAMRRWRRQAAGDAAVSSS